MQGLREQWGSAAFQGDTPHETSMLNAAALGELTAYKRLSEMTFEDYQGVMNDEE